MSDRVKTILTWIGRSLLFIAGAGASVAGYGVVQAGRVAIAPEAYGGIENISWIAQLVGGGGFTAALSAGAAWVINLVWGKLVKGSGQPFSQYTAAVSARQVLVRYLDGRPGDQAALTQLGESCKVVFTDSLDPKPAPAVVVK